MDPAFEAHRSGHVMSELGFEVARDGDELCGAGVIVEGMLVPGTAVVRTSILASWVDTIAGLQASRILAPEVPVTLGLDLDLCRRPLDAGRILAATRELKVGRSVVVVEVGLTTGDGTRIGVGTVSFMAVRSPAMTLPGLDELVAATRVGGPRLAQPFAERVGCERSRPGRATVPLSGAMLNASASMHGGLLALVAEEAALSMASGSVAASLGLHYLRPMRIGPAVATASLDADLARVEVADAGADGRLAVVASARLVPADGVG